jgi:hypothetical protein
MFKLWLKLAGVLLALLVALLIGAAMGGDVLAMCWRMGYVLRMIAQIRSLCMILVWASLFLWAMDLIHAGTLTGGWRSCLPAMAIMRGMCRTA